MKMQFLTFEQKVSLLLRFGTLSSSHSTATYYFTPSDEALDAFGYTEEEKENFAPFWGESLGKVVDHAFDRLVSTYLKKKESPF